MEMVTWVQFGTIVALVASVFGFYRWLSSEFASTATAMDKEREERLRVERDLASYKLTVSQSYVSAVALRETEERLITAVEKLAVRMETVVGRLDQLATNMLRSTK